MGEHDASEARRDRACRLIQLEYRALRCHREKLEIMLARELADERMPHADGKLYRAKPLTEPCRSGWRDGAPVKIGVFDTLGVGASLYMRLLLGSRRLFVGLFVQGRGAWGV